MAQLLVRQASAVRVPFRHVLKGKGELPANTAADPVCPLPPQIWIKNKQVSNIHLDKVAVAFPDPALNKTIMVGGMVGLDVPAGGNTAWYASNDQYLFLPSPPPSPFTITLYFSGFDPWSDAVHFVPFPNSYRFPGRNVDLGADEFWVRKGAAHAGGGDQIFHYDLGMMGWDPGMSQWRDVFPGKDGTSNDHYRIWNRPVYALADGVVTFYENSVNENPKPGVVSAEGNTKGYGNAFNIQHGEYLGTYMHMLTLPDPPPIDVWTAQIRAQVGAMGPAERRRALERIRRAQEYALSLERELNKQR